MVPRLSVFLALFALVCIALPASALARGATSRAPNFYPLHLGTWWDYSETTPVGALSVMDRVVSSSTKNGVTTAVVRSEQHLGTRKLGYSYTTYVEKVSGVYFTHGPGRLQLILPLPPTIGRRWSAPATQSTGPRHRVHDREYFWVVSRNPLTVAKHHYAQTIQIAYGVCPAGSTPSIARCGTVHAFFAPHVGQVLTLNPGQSPVFLVRFGTK